MAVRLLGFVRRAYQTFKTELANRIALEVVEKYGWNTARENEKEIGGGYVTTEATPKRKT